MTIGDALSDRRPPARARRLPAIRAVGWDDWTQLARFVLVGSSGYLINLAVFAAAVEWFGAHYWTAGIAAFAVAWCNNFVWNKYWTFRRHRLSTLHQSARYLAVSLIALAVNLALLHLLIEAGLMALAAQAIAIVAVTPISFLVNRRWSFR